MSVESKTESETTCEVCLYEHDNASSLVECETCNRDVCAKDCVGVCSSCVAPVCSECELECKSCAKPRSILCNNCVTKCNVCRLNMCSDHMTDSDDANESTPGETCKKCSLDDIARIDRGLEGFDRVPHIFSSLIAKD
jgi:hypothetical protein